MEDLISKITFLKTKIESEKNKKSVLIGRISELKNNLKNEFSIEFSEIDNLIEKTEKETKEKETELIDLIKKIESEFNNER